MSPAGLALQNPYFELFRALEGERDELRLALRKKLIWAYSWAVPSPEAIETLAALSPIVEIGAGTGYWAWLLAQCGASARAFDHEPLQSPRWTEISRGGPESAASKNETLLLCWPPLGAPMADEALARFEGQHAAYAGEWRGRTGDAAFHDRLEREWKKEREIPLPRWPGYRDSLYLFSRER